MKNKDTPTVNRTNKVNNANIDWVEQGLPLSKNFDDFYFSKVSGIEESEYVFLAGNELQQTWEQSAWQQAHDSATFCIGETGFGTGLNFLVAWRLWIQSNNQKNSKQSYQQRSQPTLQFYSVEKYPLSREDLRRSLLLWPELSDLSEQLVQAYPPQPISGLHKMQFQDGEVSLSIYFGEATEGFSQLASITKAGPQVSVIPCNISTKRPQIHAWFLDGFAPAKNPEMWTPELFQVITTLSHKGTRFATFTAASEVRRDLIKAGFTCQKRKGFGRKREMLIGVFAPVDTQQIQEEKTPEPITSPPEIPSHFRQYKRQKIDAEDAWHLISHQNLPSVNSCLIIGGGLAGCHTARALAEKGIQVTLIEKNAAIAEEASGNLQGAVYAKLSPHQDPISRFNLSSLLFANQLYQSQNYYQQCGEQSGILHYAVNARQQQLYREIAEHFSDKDFAQWLSPKACERVSGVTAQFPALFLPQAGWLAPKELCKHLLQHANIRCIYKQTVDEIAYKDKRWHAYSIEKTLIADADAMVLCNAHELLGFAQSLHLPLKRIRGQVSILPATEQSQKLQCVLCGDGYTTPTHNNRHAFGATFTLHNSTPDILEEDHRENLEKLASLSPDFKTFASLPLEGKLDGKVGFRCTTPDYFPVVGPVADFEAMTERFGFLRKKANAVIDSPGVYHPHLYCNVGHGSRGLCYTPLCSDLLASIITGQFLPIARELYQHLHPARFIIRDLMRNKI